MPETTNYPPEIRKFVFCGKRKISFEGIGETLEIGANGGRISNIASQK